MARTVTPSAEGGVGKCEYDNFGKFIFFAVTQDSLCRDTFFIFLELLDVDGENASSSPQATDEVDIPPKTIRLDIRPKMFQMPIAAVIEAFEEDAFCERTTPDEEHQGSRLGNFFSPDRYPPAHYNELIKDLVSFVSKVSLWVLLRCITLFIESFLLTGSIFYYKITAVFGLKFYFCKSEELLA